MGAARSADAWMRDVLEGAPWAVRAFLRVGWRAVLGFRLAPGGTPGHVLGWPVATASEDAIALEQRSALMSARLGLRASPTAIEWTTSVRYEHAATRVVWAIVGVLHRRMVPYLLRGAVARRSRPRP